MVALFACTSHLVDIGGLGPSSDGKQVYHEGLFIPIMPLAREGEMDEWVLNLVKANVREPVQVEGDIYALVACNETGSNRLLAMMEEYALADLDQLGEHIIRTSRKGMECDQPTAKGQLERQHADRRLRKTHRPRGETNGRRRRDHR